MQLEEFRKAGHQNNLTSKNISAKNYNKNLKKIKFSINDKVLKHVDVLASKFFAIWEGPFIIARIGDKGSYTIKDSGGNMDIVNGDKLNPYIQSNRMIPELKSAGLKSTLRRFRQINTINVQEEDKGGELLYI
ncbi:hypothetical protein AYI69_g7640 [Smittium culicis]|uniref:Pol polyprotein n=1 Tax=Smittium culicis TaxID=133412 RepID=A0A1R1XQK6_9FUNG|nr:hypothetical protein AYI69_g7640 [Smittium culicis]